MANLDTLNRGELYNEIAELARANGVNGREGWSELVDEVLDSHLDLAELDPDNDLQGLKDVLVGMYEEYERTAGPMSDRAIDEDPEAPHA